MEKRIYIVILNWKGWKDTLECLESVFRLKHPDFRVVVCDNASGDGSVQRVIAWANGEFSAPVQSPALAEYSQPPIQKPLSVVHLCQNHGSLERTAGERTSPLAVIETGGNLGFAGGCNVGIRYALEDPLCGAVWLLNNDTVVPEDSLSKMVEYADQNPGAGIIGSTIRYYYAPSRVQAYGGTRYSRWMSRTPALTKEDESGKNLDCILGCSMLVSRAFLEKVGLMSEDYFLYFEELDWAARAKPDFSLGYAPESVVYHKEGASIGSSGVQAHRSMLSERFLARNRIVFTRKFYPWLLPSVMFWVIAAAVTRLLKGDLPRARLILASAMEGLRIPLV